MKKYSMLIITIIMIIATAISYAYEFKDLDPPEYKEPHINIHSEKFGEINDILWASDFISPQRAIIILSSYEYEGENRSSIYYLDIDTGKTTLLSDYPSHKNLNDAIVFKNGFSENNIITAYDKGIVKTQIVFKREDPQIHEVDFGIDEMVEIEGFEDATSMDYSSGLFFTKEKDNLIYSRTFNQDFFYGMFNQNMESNKTHYRHPYEIINANGLNNTLAYTSINNNKKDIYLMNYDGSFITTFNTPVIKNVVTAKSISDGFGFIGMTSEDDENTLEVFIHRRYPNEVDPYKLDTIPFNIDIYGAIPSIDSTTFNEDYSLAYTSYDENHNGSIKVSSFGNEPKVILEDDNLYGPVRITSKRIDGKEKKLILYYTLENDEPKIKICDIEGNLFKDITSMIVK